LHERVATLLDLTDGPLEGVDGAVELLERLLVEGVDDGGGDLLRHRRAAAGLRLRDEPDVPKAAGAGDGREAADGVREGADQEGGVRALDGQRGGVDLDGLEVEGGTLLRVGVAAVPLDDEHAGPGGEGGGRRRRRDGAVELHGAVSAVVLLADGADEVAVSVELVDRAVLDGRAGEASGE